MIFYKVYKNGLKISGAIQPNLESWLWNEDDAVKYQLVNYNLREGTLLIQLVDTKLSQIVWQGYASGMFDRKNLNKEMQLKRAVGLVFDQYPLFTREFMAHPKRKTLAEEGK